MHQQDNPNFFEEPIKIEILWRKKNVWEVVITKYDVNLYENSNAI